MGGLNLSYGGKIKNELWKNFDFGRLKVFFFFQEVHARARRKYLMKKNFFYDVVLSLLFIFSILDRFEICF